MSLSSLWLTIPAFEPHCEKNFVEYVVISLMMLVGGLAWAYVLSMLCSIFSALNPRETEFKNLMDELGYFMEDRGFSDMHKRRLRDFFTYTKDFSRESGYASIFNQMSNKLRADTALIIGEKHLARVWYLTSEDLGRRGPGCEKGFLCEVALNMRPAVYEMHEPLGLDSLTIIRSGLVAKRMRLLGAGQVVGIDCILAEHHSGLRDDDPINCLSFVQAAHISRDTLFSLADNYPDALATLKMAARHMTIRQALIIFYRKFVKLNRKLPGRMETVVGSVMMNDYEGSKQAHTDMRAASPVGHGGGGSSAAVEQRLDELTQMVRALTINFDRLQGGGRLEGRGSSLGAKASFLAEGSKRGHRGGGPGKSFSRNRSVIGNLSKQLAEPGEDEDKAGKGGGRGGVAGEQGKAGRSDARSRSTTCGRGRSRSPAPTNSTRGQSMKQPTRGGCGGRPALS